ncbi:hypothetical protein EG834_12465 [bacterium]|nr:hypothetical protein [bacterium]
MSRGRWFGFIAAVLVGLTAGLIYGWVIRPSSVSNTSLASLRDDYKADYVLMVAETYNASGDLSQASQDLDQILPGKPLIAVQSAIITAQQLGYAVTDLRLMAQLETGLKASNPTAGVTP